VVSSVAEDTLAISLFRHAEDTGQPINLGLTKKWLSGLLSHDAECDCGLCDAARRVRPYGVYRIASAWVRGVGSWACVGRALRVVGGFSHDCDGSSEILTLPAGLSFRRRVRQEVFKGMLARDPGTGCPSTAPPRRLVVPLGGSRSKSRNSLRDPICPTTVALPPRVPGSCGYESPPIGRYSG
jgi:hypothetical protein